MFVACLFADTTLSATSWFRSFSSQTPAAGGIRRINDKRRVRQVQTRSRSGISGTIQENCRHARSISYPIGRSSEATRWYEFPSVFGVWTGGRVGKFHFFLDVLYRHLGLLSSFRLVLESMHYANGLLAMHPRCTQILLVLGWSRLLA